MLPSSFSVKQCSYKLESHAREHFIDFAVNFGDNKKIVFNQVQFLKLVLRIHRLSDIAENLPTEVTITLDGSRSKISLFHIIFGVKIYDTCARDSVSRELLLLVEENSVVTSTIQS